MTTYFDTRSGWLRDLRQVASAIYDEDGMLTSDHYAAMDARCYRLRLADPIGADVDFFFRGLADAWVASPTEYTALVIVQAIEREVIRDMEAVKVACTLVKIGSQHSLALHRWTLRYTGDRPPEELAQIVDRVRDMCSDAHDLMHSVAQAYRCSDNPRNAVHGLWEMVR